MRGNHAVSGFPDIHLVRHCLHLLRNSMDHLLQIFESYFMFDVLDAAWKTFLDSAQRCHDMDALIASHAQYVSEITSKCFLDEAPPHNLKKSLEDILLQIHQFTAMHAELDRQLSHMQTLRDEQLAVLQQAQQEQEQAQAEADDVDMDPRDSYLGALPMSAHINIMRSATTDDEYAQKYTALRKKQDEILFLFKSFHHKISKLLELPKANKAIPEYISPCSRSCTRDRATTKKHGIWAHRHGPLHQRALHELDVLPIASPDPRRCRVAARWTF